MVEVNIRTISIQHITIVSNKSFEDTRAAFEKALGRLDENVFVLLQYGQVERAMEVLESLPPLVIAGVRDHGILLKVWGQDRKALRYDCGNALTATKMTRHQLSAGLYAPLRVLLRESREGEVAFEYDRPSDVFRQLGDLNVDAVAKDLDVLLEDTLREVAA
ncbi:hypothetical protein Pth03_57010 [Planotetraspora thailandica]|uniref:DUF302 domain-containing protein n=1 Tax=Planotetraspora thailandica TaxID=487172 RepID=A0A8J3V8B8_9ACTN|nr:DUF302 domain-containing protein [Planotetraspora thailandica]GII57312.1 hypothetical protein Pth03_57010 [Planotetraspora thailandica]